MTEARPLRYAVIEVTNRCNLRCPHCGSSSGRARDDELSLNEIRELTHLIGQLGGEEITIIGGEALLREDWADICQAVVAAGMKLLLLTNGIRLTRDERALATLRQLRPYLVGVSIDGASRESYERLRGVDAFESVVELCHRLVADGHDHVNAITTFWKANVHEFDQFLSLFAGTDVVWQVQLANKGGKRFAATDFLSLDQYAWLAARMTDVLADPVRRVALCPMDDFGYFPLDPALRFLHERWTGCLAGVELCGIRSNGDVLGCLSLGDDFVEGNVRDRRLDRLWQDPVSFSRFRNKLEQLRGHCAVCAFAERCRAGCSAIAHSATGHIGENPYCLRHLETRRIIAELVARG